MQSWVFKTGKIHSYFPLLLLLFLYFPPTVHSETMTWWMSVDCNPFIPCGGGNREPGISFGLSEPESLWTEPPLPSNWEIFFLIIFLSLALRFWNQIFTCNVVSYVWSVKGSGQLFTAIVAMKKYICMQANIPSTPLKKNKPTPTLDFCSRK